MESTSYHSHQSNMLMSPRRLDAIRHNGNQIVSPKMASMNNKDAASQYREHMETRQQDLQSQMSKTSKFGAGFGAQRMNPDLLNQNDYEAMDVEIAMNQNLHLVPCRWERSGWRYVQADPGEVKFFNNPNRVNNFGVGSATKRRFASQKRDSFYQTQTKSAFGSVGRPRDTTYGRTFVEQRSSSGDQSPWKQTATQAKMKEDPDGIQWAGENHKRQTFKKTKDFIGDWTNVLFRS